MSADVQARTVAHALELVTAAHKAKLQDNSLAVCETIARTEGATRDQVQRAVARGLQAVMLCALAVACQPAQAAVTPPADSARRPLSMEVAYLPEGTKIPGARKMGMVADCELWEIGMGEYVAVTHAPVTSSSCILTAVVVGVEAR